MAAETPPEPQCDHSGVLILKGGPHGVCPRCGKQLTAEEYERAVASAMPAAFFEVGPHDDEPLDGLMFKASGEDVTEHQLGELRSFFIAQGLHEVAEAVEDRLRTLGWRLIRRGDSKGPKMQYEVRRPEGSLVAVGYVSFKNDEREILRDMGMALLPVFMSHPTFRQGFVTGSEVYNHVEMRRGMGSNPPPKRRFNPIHAALVEGGQSKARLWADLTDNEKAFVRTEWPELDEERLSTLAWLFVEPENREGMS